MRLRSVRVSTRQQGDSCVIKWRMKPEFCAPVARRKDQGGGRVSASSAFRSTESGGFPRVLRTWEEEGEFLSRIPPEEVEVFPVDLRADGCSPANRKVRKSWQLPVSTTTGKIRGWFSRMLK
jgi:hypothetical protein